MSPNAPARAVSPAQPLVPAAMPSLGRLTEATLARPGGARLHRAVGGSRS